MMSVSDRAIPTAANPVEATTVLTATTTDEVENYTADAPTIIDYGRHRGQAVGFRPKSSLASANLAIVENLP
jgi:hypothetical protein